MKVALVVLAAVLVVAVGAFVYVGYKTEQAEDHLHDDEDQGIMRWRMRS